MTTPDRGVHLAPCERALVGAVRIHREANGIKQERVSSVLRAHGVRSFQMTVSRLEGGARNLRLHEALVLASFAGLPVDVIAAECDHGKRLCTNCMGNPPEGFVCKVCGGERQP